MPECVHKNTKKVSPKGESKVPSKIMATSCQGFTWPNSMAGAHFPNKTITLVGGSFEGGLIKGEGLFQDIE